MKKLITTLCLFVSIVAFAQSADASAVVSMDVDKTVYPVNQGNTYLNADQTAGIVGMLAPKTYAEMKTSLNDSKGDMKIVEKGEKKLNGQDVLFINGTKENEGQEFTIWIYCKQNDANSCIMVTGFYESAKDSLYRKHVEKAATSAKLNK